MWLVLDIQKEYKGTISTRLDNLLRLDNPEIGLIGLCPVFETKEQALKYFPNIDMVELGLKQKNNNTGE